MELMHGTDLLDGDNVAGWFASEKLRGWRCCWTGSDYRLRSGAVLPVPELWLEGMPATPLDGELYAGRHANEGRVKSAVACGDWDKLKFHPFDVPVEGFRIETALLMLATLHPLPHVRPVSYCRVESNAHALQLMRDTVAAGGEGIMLRRPGSPYRPGRVRSLLKLKP